MAYIVGINDDIVNVANLAALAALPTDVTVNGVATTDGTLAGVLSTNQLFKYFRYGQETVNSTTVIAANGGGQWQELFSTGENYIFVNDTTNEVGAPFIADDSVTLAMLAPGITPAAVIVAAGTGSYAGGSATATFTIAGMLNTDALVVSTITSANAVEIQKVSHSTTTASVLLSADPGASTFAYILTRAAA